MALPSKGGRYKGGREKLVGGGGVPPPLPSPVIEGVQVHEKDQVLFTHWTEGRRRWKRAWEESCPSLKELYEYRAQFWADWARALGYGEDEWVGRALVTWQELEQGSPHSLPREDRDTFKAFSLALNRWARVDPPNRVDFWRCWAKGELFKRSAGLWTKFATAHADQGWDNNRLSAEYYKSLVLDKRAEMCRALVVGHVLYIPAEVMNERSNLNSIRQAGRQAGM